MSGEPSSPGSTARRGQEGEKPGLARRAWPCVSTRDVGQVRLPQCARPLGHPYASSPRRLTEPDFVSPRLIM